MSAITVAGLGHGGIVAAIKLAGKGHTVTVLSKSQRSGCGLDQTDALDAKAMEYAGLEIPESFRAPCNIITFVPLNEDTESITLPANESYENLAVDRKEFLNYLIEKAEKAGVVFEFGCEVLAPIILGSRVAGVVTNRGNKYADLVIDACGVNSVLRRNMPDFTGIDHEPALYDVLHTYRAYFRKNTDVPDPETKYNFYLKDDGTVGFSWAVTNDDSVDVLIARFHDINYSVVAEALRKVNELNPQMSSEQIKGGSFCDIPVRQPLAVFVADGYAAVGDSAFMTYSVKGSGIAYALKAGTMLADAVIQDTDGLYNCETLWEYEKDFYKEIGFDACRIALAKNLLPYFTAAEVDDIFKNGLVSSEELSELVSGSFISILKSNPFSLLKEKIKILNNCPDFKAHLLLLISWLGKFTVLEPSFPGKYSRREVEEWQEKYNKFFDSIRRQD